MDKEIRCLFCNTELETEKTLDIHVALVHEKQNFRQCTEVRFASFFSGGFTTMVVMNPPEKKLEKRTAVQCSVCEICLTEEPMLQKHIAIAHKDKKINTTKSIYVLM